MSLLSDGNRREVPTQHGTHPLRIDNKSGIRGVCFTRGRWVAERCGRYLGSFGSAEEAAEAYAIAGEDAAQIGAHWHRPDRVKRCIDCDATKSLPDFYAYDYTTRHGKRSKRYESRCKSCSRVRRLLQHHSDPERAARQHRSWCERNAAHVQAKRKEYQASEHGRRVKAKNQRIRAAKIRAGLCDDDPRIRAIYEEAADLQMKLRACIECDDPLELQIHVDHITPLAKGGKHVFENLQLLSGRENVTKGVKTHSAWAGGRDA